MELSPEAQPLPLLGAWGEKLCLQRVATRSGEQRLPRSALGSGCVGAQGPAGLPIPAPAAAHRQQSFCLCSLPAHRAPVSQHCCHCNSSLQINSLNYQAGTGAPTHLQGSGPELSAW